MRLQVVKNVVCPFCGCLCDDLEVVVSEGKIVDVKRGCIISLTKYLNYGRERLDKPLVRKNGELVEVGLDEAIQRASELLIEANYPILYGWSSTSCEAQRVGVELAEEVGGIIDNTTTVCHGPSIQALHDVGESTCTLGEVKHRADLIVYWGSNPLQSHLRHLIRYTVASDGRFSRSRDDRVMVVIDVRKTYTARVADYFLQTEPNKDYELISALRMAIRDEEIERESVAGIPVGDIEELADLMLGCRFGILFFGLGLTMSEGKNRNIDAAISLVRDLNMRTKFLIMPMRGHFNVTGANKVFTWQTGYPFAIDFSHKYPRYNPGDTSVVDVLCRGDCDAALIVASDPVSNFPKEAVHTLTDNPLIVIDPHKTTTAGAATVAIPSAPVGIEAEGTAYRMDGVPLLLKRVIESPQGCHSDAELLRMILERVKKLKEAG